MKTKISRIGKKSLSVIIALMMIVSTMLVGMISASASITGYSAIYFTPGSNWRQADAIFKLEVDNNQVDFVCVDEKNHIYKATLDSNTTYHNLKFLRINPNNTSETWNSSITFSWISDDKSLNYYIMNNDPWSSWSVDSKNGKWSTYSGGSGETTANYYYSYYDINTKKNKFLQMDQDKKHNGSYIIRVSTINSSYAPLTNGNKFKISNAQSTDATEANNILKNPSKCVNWSEGFSPARVSKSISLPDVITFSVEPDWHDLIIENIGSNTDFYIQYTPSGTNGLAGTIKVWSVSDYDGSTEPTTTQPVETTVPPTTTPADLEGVSLSVSKTAVYVNEVFTLKATASPSDLTGVKYTFYKDGVAISDATNITSNTYETKITAAESAVYTVSATLNGKIVNSATSVTVTAEIAPINKEVTIYFKSASASAYVPSLSVDGLAPAVMTRDKKTTKTNGTYFGSTYSGSLKFYWFYTTMTLDTSVAHTLVFTTKDNRVNAKTSYTFSPAEDNKYYFAVNNLMGDTNPVDLTDKAEYIRNYHISATHMVYSETSDRNIGFTWISGTEYAMGTYLNDNNISTASLTGLTSSSLLTIPSALNPNAMLEASSAPSFFTIKSATLAQKITAEAEEVSTLQYQLLDVNLDGKVDIKDSTMMQKALAGF